MARQRVLRLLILIPTVLLWATINLYYFWITFSGGILLLTGIAELLLFLTVVVASIALIFRILLQPQWRNIKNYLTPCFAALTILALNIKQFRANENTFQSPVQIRACYEGTMNTSTLFLRQNSTFEDFNIGWFAFVSYCKGNWRRNGDTLILNFKNGKSNILDTLMMFKDRSLYKIQADTLVLTPYYLGDCKGLN